MVPPGQTTATGPERILIVDDHPLFCEALSLTLKSGTSVEEIRNFERIEAALDAVAEFNPDVILLDLDLPDVQGVDGLIRLRRIASDVPIIIVSSMTEIKVIGAALQAGANGYVPKHSRREVILQAIETVLSGSSFLPEGMIVSTQDGAGTDDGPDVVELLSQLTPQQGRILQFVCQGKLNKQIAWELGIAETTVKAHITAIFRKLGVRSRTQAVLLAQDTKFARMLEENISPA